MLRVPHSTWGQFQSIFYKQSDTYAVQRLHKEFAASNTFMDLSNCGLVQGCMACPQNRMGLFSLTSCDVIASRTFVTLNALVA